VAAAAIPHLGPTGRSVALGTAHYGEGFPVEPLLDGFVERGGRLIDVAVHYGNGAAEAAVGRWLQRAGCREDVRFLAKGCHPPRVAPEHVAPEVERTRERLGVEQVDCFVLHRDDPALDVAAWADALQAQLDAGSVATVGVSNWSTARTRQLATLLGDRLVLLSNHRSLAELVEAPWDNAVAFDADADGLPDEGIVLLAWSSLAGGYFAGTESTDALVRRSWHSPANEARRERARALGQERGVATGTVALAWLLAQPGMLTAIGPQTVEQLEEGLAAEELELSADERAWLRDGDGPG
jgi:aryl-alcohol dehydrogenase-like predicted oxidoreductase